MKNLVTTIKSWNIDNFHRLQEKDRENEWHLISDKDDLTKERVDEINPRYIFVPHWSWIIPKDIWQNYETIIFHTADLPYGRGGTPVQNHIARGMYDIQISALQAVQEIDAGPVYMKKPFSMEYGNVDEILTRFSKTVFDEMIPEIMIEQPEPVPQSEEGVLIFERRTPEQSNLLELKNPSQKELYDFIRMLDGEGYPRAYIPVEGGKIEFYSAGLSKEVKERFYTKSKFVPDYKENE